MKQAGQTAPDQTRLLGLSRNIGLIAGAYIMAAIFARGAGTEEFTHGGSSAITSGMRLTFVAASGLMVVGMGVMLAEQAAGRQRRGM